MFIQEGSTYRPLDSFKEVETLPKAGNMCYEPTEEAWCRLLAWHYVNTCGSNQIAAYMKTNEDFGTPTTHANANSIAYKQFKKKRVKDYIKQFREENQANYPQMRDDNIAMLRDMAANGTRAADRLNAIKELNNMMGYNQQNVKVESDSIEVVIN